MAIGGISTILKRCLKRTPFNFITEYKILRFAVQNKKTEKPRCLFFNADEGSILSNKNRLLLKMDSADLIKNTIAFVKQTLKNAEGGHDWWHIYRVWKSAIHINKEEKANDLVVQLGALLHDIADSKFNNGDETIGPIVARTFLESHLADEKIMIPVIDIIENISFQGGFNSDKEKSLELQVVQDADRLDAIGAIGVARAFNYGGFKNRTMYDPEVKPALYDDKETYKKNTAPTINHFYEKLLLLKDKMNTKTGMKVAAQRHQFMELYLQQFMNEWEVS